MQVLAQGIKNSLAAIEEQNPKVILNIANSQCSRLTDLVFQNARSSSLPDCLLILDVLCCIYEALHPTIPKISNQDSLEDDDYIPTELSFRLLVRWMLVVTQKSIISNSKIKEEIEIYISMLLEVLFIFIIETSSHSTADH